MNLEELEKEIKKIQERNKRVELDKAWETSFMRKIVLALMTYLVILCFFIFAGLPNPFFNSLVPALAFLISTFSLPVIKKFWISYTQKK